MNSGRSTAATVSALMAMTYLALSISAGAQSKQEPVILDSPAAYPQNAAELAELRSAGLKEYDLGHFAEAQRLLESAMALAGQTGDTYVVALIHGSLGIIYHDEYEFTKAEQEFKKAVDILRRQPEHSYALAMTLANFGAALCGDSRYREASTLLSEASKLVTKNALEDPQLQVHILDVSATVHLHERQFKKAEVLLLHALRISSLPKNVKITEAADIYNNLAPELCTVCREVGERGRKKPFGDPEKTG